MATLNIPNLGIWSDFYKYLQNHYRCCQAKNLNTTQNQEILIIKICNTRSIKNFYLMHASSKNLVDNLYLDPEIKFMIAIIPKTTNFKINTIKNNTAELHSHLKQAGLVLSGLDISENIKNLMDIHHASGKILFNKGKPHISIPSMKNVSVQNINGLSDGNISGENVIIDYEHLSLKIGNVSVHFSEINSRIKFVSPECFYMRSQIIFAKDMNGNILIICHPQIDYFNAVLLLTLFGTSEAISYQTKQMQAIWSDSDKNICKMTNSVTNSENNILVISS